MPPKSSTAAAKAPADNRTLPTKEAGLFKQVLQQYEAKQWKKGVKTADAILKVKPDHGGAQLLLCVPMRAALT
jgi:peptide alpha-N-acetyltransferase